MEVAPGDLRARYDLVIIGAGPAGLTVASKYEERTGNKVLVIESGPRSETRDNHAQQLALTQATGDLDATHYSTHSRRIFGGTSTVWVGYCAVLEERSFLNNEWPFSYDELYGYYPEAAKILELPEKVYTRPEVAFPENANIVYKPYYLSAPTRFNESFNDWLDANVDVDVLFNHSAVKIMTNVGIAPGVSIRESSKNRTTPIQAFGDTIVLAAGGIQNPRLLRISLPEDGKVIGSYFCEHPHSYEVASIIVDMEKLYQVMDTETQSIVHGIALSSEFCNQHSLKSATFEVSAQGEASSSNLLGERRNTLTLKTTVRAEMSAVPSNAVTLSNHLDFLGQPIAQLNLKFDPEELRVASELLNSELVRSGLGRLSILPEKFKIDGGGHMMGSTRMGNDPGESVTDSWGRVHGIDNLYVAGSSLFPAAGAANPTLTIVALALRLADHLTESTK